MNKYMRKWHFSKQLKFKYKDVVITANFKGFINTEHECRANKEIPKILPKAFEVQISKDEEGFHGAFVNPFTNTKDYIIKTELKVKHVSGEINNTVESIIDQNNELLYLPEMIFVVYPEEITSIWDLTLEDGFSRMEENDKELYKECEIKLKEIKDFEKVCNYAKRNVQSAAPIKILTTQMIKLANNLISIVFNDSIQIDFPNEHDKIYEFLLKYIRENYLKN